MERMTQTSVANLRVADRAGFEHIKHGDGKNAVLVWVERKGNRAYLSGKTGPMAYPDILKARRNVKRIRPDLEPTEI